MELQLHRGAGARLHRELEAFVRYCVSRIERELGEIERWSVTIAPSGGAFASVVSIQDDGHMLAEGVGLDGALAVWEAMCKVERSLRETRAPGSPGGAAVRPLASSLLDGVRRAG